MSTHDYHCHFLNTDCNFFNPLKLQDEHLCKACGYDIDLHANSGNFIPNASFVTPSPAPTPLWCYARTESNSEHASQGPPTPDHDNFLPIIPGMTSENVARSAINNHQLLKLSNEFSPSNQKQYLEKNMSSLWCFIFVQTCISWVQMLQNIKSFSVLLILCSMWPLTIRALPNHYATSFWKLLKIK